MAVYSLVLEEAFASAVRRYNGSEAARLLLDGIDMAFRGQKQIEVEEAWREHEEMGRTQRYTYYDVTVEQALELLPDAMPFQDTARARGVIERTPDKDYTLCLRVMEEMPASLALQYETGGGVRYRHGFLLTQHAAAVSLIERYGIEAQKAP